MIFYQFRYYTCHADIFSIAIGAGIAFAFFAFLGMKSLVGEFRDLTPGVWVI